jgi:hypothetical protein
MFLLERARKQKPRILSEKSGNNSRNGKASVADHTNKEGHEFIRADGATTMTGFSRLRFADFAEGRAICNFDYAPSGIAIE